VVGKEQSQVSKEYLLTDGFNLCAPLLDLSSKMKEFCYKEINFSKKYLKNLI
jgi:hypothetical protein